MAVEEEVYECRLMKPWDHPKVASDPWHLQEWRVDLNAGNFVMCQNIVKKKRGQWIREGIRKDQPEGFGSLIFLEKPDIDRIFNLSSEHDVKLLEALVMHKGENHFPPAYLEAVEDCPNIKAHAKYAPPEVVLPKSVKQKRAKKKASSKSEPSFDAVAHERLGNPEE